MRKTVNRMVVLFVVATITSAAAWASTTRKSVTFADAVTVNGTLVKRGTYEVSFDEATSQLTIAQGRKVIATAEAKLEKVGGIGQDRYVVATSAAAKAPALISISLKGGNQATIINSGS